MLAKTTELAGFETRWEPIFIARSVSSPAWILPIRCIIITRQIGNPAQARGRVNFSFLSFSSEDGSSERNIINKTTNAEIPLVIFHEYPESKPEKKESMHPSPPPNPGASVSLSISCLRYRDCAMMVQSVKQWGVRGPLGTKVYFRNLGISY